ncbi:Hypothetical Protein H9401_5504 (plasmid) [Bacillus anthracis str. H9401]|nr:Hypothetical Protein H9401_5504 [Bacillus anthracis str. H9401]
MIKYRKSPEITAFVANFFYKIGTRLGKNVASFPLEIK